MGLPLYFGSVDVDVDVGADAAVRLVVGIEDVPLGWTGGLVLGVDFLGGAGFASFAIVVVELDTFACGLFPEMPDSVGCGMAALGCPLVDAGL